MNCRGYLLSAAAAAAVCRLVPVPVVLVAAVALCHAIADRMPHSVGGKLWPLSTTE